MYSSELFSLNSTIYGKINEGNSFYLRNSQTREGRKGKTISISQARNKLESIEKTTKGSFYEKFLLKKPNREKKGHKKCITAISNIQDFESLNEKKKLPSCENLKENKTRTIFNSTSYRNKNYMHEYSVKDYLGSLRKTSKSPISFFNDTAKSKIALRNQIYRKYRDTIVNLSPKRNATREKLKVNLSELIDNILIKIHKFYELHENKKVFRQSILKSLNFEPQMKRFLEDKAIDKLAKPDFIEFLKSFRRTFFYSKRKSAQELFERSKIDSNCNIIDLVDVSNEENERNIGQIEKTGLNSLFSLNNQMEINIYQREMLLLGKQQNFIQSNISEIETMKGFSSEVKSSLNANFKKFSFRNADIIERLEEFERKKGTVFLNLSEVSRAKNKELKKMIISLKK